MLFKEMYPVCCETGEKHTKKSIISLILYLWAENKHCTLTAYGSYHEDY